MAEMNVKLKQRNPQKVTSNQEITDKSFCLIVHDYL